MKIWVTKYLFTAGIEVVDAKISCDMATEGNPGRMSSRHFHGNEWHKTEAKANEHALVMCAKKRKTIAAQLKEVDDIEAKLRASMRGR